MIILVIIIVNIIRDKIKNLTDGIVDSWNWLGVGDTEVFENYPQFKKEIRRLNQN